MAIYLYTLNLLELPPFKPRFSQLARLYRSVSLGNSINHLKHGFAGCLVKGAADRLVQSIAYDIQESPYFSDEFFDIVKDSFCFDQNGSGFTLKSEEILGQIKGPDNVMHDVVGIDTDYGPSIAFKSSIPPHSDY